MVEMNFSFVFNYVRFCWYSVDRSCHSNDIEWQCGIECFEQSWYSTYCSVNTHNDILNSHSNFQIQLSFQFERSKFKFGTIRFFEISVESSIDCNESSTESWWVKEVFNNVSDCIFSCKAKNPWKNAIFACPISHYFIRIVVASKTSSILIVCSALRYIIYLLVNYRKQ